MLLLQAVCADWCRRLYVQVDEVTLIIEPMFLPRTVQCNLSVAADLPFGHNQ